MPQPAADRVRCAGRRPQPEGPECRKPDPCDGGSCGDADGVPEREHRGGVLDRSGASSIRSGGPPSPTGTLVAVASQILSVPATRSVPHPPAATALASEP